MDSVAGKAIILGESKYLDYVIVHIQNKLKMIFQVLPVKSVNSVRNVT
ncbi:MAG: hypothetical protein QXI71_03405 [Candidatus Bathyarchaeia archaeon]|nr:hypothetical protein [Candidatus Bathyarchaeota archaeon]